MYPKKGHCDVCCTAAVYGDGDGDGEGLALLCCCLATVALVVTPSSHRCTTRCKGSGNNMHNHHPRYKTYHQTHTAISQERALMCTQRPSSFARQVPIKVAAGRCVPRLLLHLPTWRSTLLGSMLDDVMITLLGSDQDTVTLLTAMAAVCDLAQVDDLRDAVASAVRQGNHF